MSKVSEKREPPTGFADGGSEDRALPGRARGVGASEDQHYGLPDGPLHHIVGDASP